MSETPAILNRTVAIVGRPNVGKSSLFNRMAGRRIAIVHEQSGVTRDRLNAEVIRGEDRFELIDTGGIGVIDHKAAADTIEAGILDQAEAAIEDAGLILFVVDVMRGITPLDREVAQHLRQSGRPVWSRRPIRLSSVDFPDPERPTIDTRSPGSTVRSTPFRMVSAG